MTTVLATLDGIAADTRVGDMRVSKVLRGPGQLVAITGDAYTALRLAKWILDGERGSPGEVSDDVELVILRRDGIYTMNHRGMLIRSLRSWVAEGSGSDFAAGAYLVCGDPVKAVEIAAAEDSASGLPVEWHPFKRGRK